MLKAPLRNCIPRNGGGDLRFPAKALSQLVADGWGVLPALEESADEEGGDVDEGRPPDEVGDGTVEGQRPALGDRGTRAQFGERINASDVTDVEPAVDPAVRMSTQHRRTRTCWDN